MNIRLFAILIFAFAGGGCASRAQRHSQDVLLPQQPESNLSRRMTVDDESSVKKTIKPESKSASKKRVQTKGTEPEAAEAEKPEETSTQPDRFR